MNFPFVAVTGQPLFKLALILAAINPSIGGVLVSGPRGSAKSTLSRALADVLPDGGAFVTLPLGASEEMLIGSLDLQQALKEQQVQFNPGLLAKAHQGVLYVDEVNLLPDGLVDVLLDVAASKVNIIERDGISHQHPADFVLIGTMNPDEGELRPQLQDRFGLCVELTNRYSIAERMEIVQVREAFDRDPSGFCQQHATAQQQLIAQIMAAKQQLAGVACPDAMRLLIAERCHAAQVEGMRADLVWYRAALAHAAWQGRAVVEQADIDAVEALVLLHRRQNSSNQPPAPPSPPPYSRPPQSRGAENQPPSNAPDSAQTDAGDWGSMPPQAQQSQPLSEQVRFMDNTATLSTPKPKTPSTIPAGKRNGPTAGGSRQGKQNATRINWFATLSHNLRRHQPVAQWQWRYRKQQQGQAVLHLVLLDTSASVLSGQAFAKAKGVLMQIAQQAYLARERLSILGFGNQQVETLLPLVRAPKQIQQMLDQVTAGGGTPLQAVLQQARQLITSLKRQQTDLRVSLYLLTDGRISTLPEPMMLADSAVLIDTEQSAVKRGRGRELAQCLGAEYVSLSSAQTV